MEPTATRAEEFAEIPKSGRTHLHDAVPMKLGEELGAWGATVRRGLERLRMMEGPLPGVLRAHRRSRGHAQ